MALSDRDREIIDRTIDRSMGRFGIDTENPQEQRSDLVWLRGARKIWVYVVGAVITGIAVAAAVPH